MANLYPGIHVISTDLSPIQLVFVLLNCHSEIEDVYLDWTCLSNYLDFIHI